VTPSLLRLAATAALAVLVLAATNMFLLALPKVEPTLTGVAPQPLFAPMPSAFLSPTGSRPVVASVDPPATVRAAMRATTGWVSPLEAKVCRPPYGGGQYGASRDDNGDGVTDRYHAGIDLGGREGLPTGTPVRAVGPGTVVAAGWSGGAGNRVKVRHADGAVTVYKHLSRIDVWSGPVTAGQRIGLLGNTGHSFGPHVHIDVVVGGSNVDPLPWLLARGVDLRCA